MGTSHKKALILIFSLMFTFLIIGTVVIAIELQHIGIASILFMAGIILAMDIRQVSRNKDNRSGFTQPKF
jgi:hypothetical protein